MSNRSILVAGATGGLGSRIARTFADGGDSVFAVGRHAERLAELGLPHTALDLRLPDACQTAISSAVDAHGALDVVVNATGVVAFGPVSDLSIDTMEELFLTNTFIPIMLDKAALPTMNEGGVIVNISGVIAEQNLPGMAAYGASKAAVRSFDEALVREARRRKVRVLDARPPHTETGLAGRAIEGVAPKMPAGLDPDAVAQIICAAVDGDATDLPSSAFSD